ncbi:unnamed protein product, partial [Didymodactylos carnosus]
MPTVHMKLLLLCLFKFIICLIYVIHGTYRNEPVLFELLMEECTSVNPVQFLRHLDDTLKHANYQIIDFQHLQQLRLAICAHTLTPDHPEIQLKHAIVHLPLMKTRENSMIYLKYMNYVAYYKTHINLRQKYVMYCYEHHGHVSKEKFVNDTYIASFHAVNDGERHLTIMVDDDMRLCYPQTPVLLEMLIYEWYGKQQPQIIPFPKINYYQSTDKGGGLIEYADDPYLGENYINFQKALLSNELLQQVQVQNGICQIIAIICNLDVRDIFINDISYDRFRYDITTNRLAISQYGGAVVGRSNINRFSQVSQNRFDSTLYRFALRVEHFHQHVEPRQISHYFEPNQWHAYERLIHAVLNLGEGGEICRHFSIVRKQNLIEKIAETFHRVTGYHDAEERAIAAKFMRKFHLHYSKRRNLFTCDDIPPNLLKTQHAKSPIDPLKMK